MLHRDTLLSTFDGLLQPQNFQDYGPNGLQVEGRPEIRKIVSGVTANLAFIEAAVAASADALFVHHGLFWRSQSACVTGWMRKRLGALLAADVNLFAYHLPLDAHPEFGNNAMLGARLGCAVHGRFGDQGLGVLGHWLAPERGDWSVGQLADHVGQALGRAPTYVDGGRRPLRTLAWCTGGAQSYFEAAISAGADVYLTGEISEPQAHLARETGVSFLACGHHATERWGAPALAEHVARVHGIAHEFIDVDNPA